MIKTVLHSLLFFCLYATTLCGQNQTPTTTPVLPPDNLPFEISIELMDLLLPNGWHSGATANWEGQTLLVAGRTNGLHGFDNDPNVNNFPPRAQNTVLYVIDFKHGKVWQRSLTDPASGLTQDQIDYLSVTSPQSYQKGHTLYITGGYGLITSTGQMDTMPVLSALNVPGLIHWVKHPDEPGSVAELVRQIIHPLVKVTGGYMNQTSSNDPTLLIFGQNFVGSYTDNSNGIYTQQVRTFQIVDNGTTLEIIPSDPQPATNAAYRRRDLNVLPIIVPGNNLNIPGYVAFSGVFTEAGGIWTVPVNIASNGTSAMPDPLDPSTFKQGMNNYASATVGLFSEHDETMYAIFFGGITYGLFKHGVFSTEPEIPFTNQVTTIKIEGNYQYSQYIMENQYPIMRSRFANPGHILRFGAGAQFITLKHLSQYQNGVLKLDHLLNEEHVIGYIVGGIQSSRANTNTRRDSAASPYIFRVTLRPRSS